MNTDADIFNKVLANQIQLYIKKDHTLRSNEFYSRDLRMVKHHNHKSINMLHPTKKIKNKSYTIISVDAEKDFDKV